jgi:hypothetical protein
LCSIGKGNNLTCRSAQSTHGTQGKEKKKKEEEEEKEKKVAFLLAIPGCLVNTLTIFHGIKEIASGGRDSIFVVSTMMRGIPSVMAWKRGNATGSRREGHENMTSAANPPRHTHI